MSLSPPWSLFCQLTNAKVSPGPLELRSSREPSEESECVSENEELVEALSQIHPPIEEAFNGKRFLSWEPLSVHPELLKLRGDQRVHRNPFRRIVAVHAVGLVMTQFQCTALGGYNANSSP